MRFLLGLVLLVVLLAGAYPWIDKYLPPGYHPFSPLSVDDPPTWIAVLMRAQAAGRIAFREQPSSTGACPLDNPVRAGGVEREFSGQLSAGVQQCHVCWTSGCASGANVIGKASGAH